jgi:predicted AlkP superfamily pyrophosphatase or phosphodiesterase
MTKLIVAALTGVTATVLVAGVSLEPPAQEARPRLVVLVAVDQLPAHLLDRYDSLFTGGFRRLRDQGFRFTQANHQHANTETAAGHAALSTGVLPFRNGIVANSWRERSGDEWHGVYAVEDSLSPISGIPQLPGRSPANLLRDGLGDWMQQADPDTKILSLSRKDRSAITLAGRTSDAHVYWLVPSANRWVTSVYYREAYSRWFEAFHQQVLPEIAADSVWESTIPAGSEVMARPDTAAYEADGVHTYFPHRFLEEGDLASEQGYAAWLSSTPWVDDATLALAEHGMRALELGQDDVPDLLGLALSQTDIVGHRFGPLSREQLDNLLRLDRGFGDFLTFLDDYVGEGRWVLGLSADHGVLTMPEYLAESGEFGKRTTRDEITEMVDAVRRASAVDNDRSPADVAAEVKRALEEVDWVDAVYTAWDLREEEPADTFEVLYRNSYLPERATGFFGEMGVMVRPKAGVLVSTSTQGTSHGSPYWYDRHVPLAFLGAGVGAGSSDQAARTIDMAPTLASLAGIRAPNDLDGTPLIP